VATSGKTQIEFSLRVMTSKYLPLRFSPVSGSADDAPYWPLADIPSCAAHVCFWPKADIPSCTAHVRFWE
jgi:hypothetical protein